ncbi:Gfo/Idh/MocA family protein [Pseudonocardia xishanensis]|uniref:Gfo/Idh/MocA family oxidoreductase n=1 Tax=Pseudonocardia xishanensis TaxID=630995 RepID=A0ABP8REN1_9PSEU
MDALRVGLVGAGPWARTVHAPALAAHAGVDFAGVWTRRPTDLADAHGTTAFPTFAALLAEVDAVALAVPPSVQGVLAVEAAEAGRHLILDKPLADALPAGERVAAAVAAAAVASTTVFTLRFHPPVREFLAGFSGPADAATTASARWLSGAALGGPYAASRWRAERGALLDVGPHLVDLLDAALGEIVAVDFAHRGDPDLWRIGLRHVGGASSTLVLSRGIPVDPTVMEVTAYGSVGSHRLTSRPDDPRAGYGAMLDELLADIRARRLDGPYSAARSLHVQRVLAEVEARV